MSDSPFCGPFIQCSRDHTPLDEIQPLPPATETLILRITLASNFDEDAVSPAAISLQIPRLQVLGNAFPGADFSEKIKKYVVDPKVRKSADERKFKRFHEHPGINFKPTAMSLRKREKTRLVFHLDDRLGWCFARDYAPVSQAKDLKGQGIFSNPRLIDTNGNILPEGEYVSGSRFATANFDPSSIPDKDDFVTRYNLNVEFLSDPSDVSGSYTPVILDPDVRWPGGNEP